MLVSMVHGVGPQVNKFEQVSSDNHSMSVAGRPVSGVWCLREGVDSMSGSRGSGNRSHVWCLMGVGPMSQCIIGNGHMGPLPHSP